jgi:hypothetical protein
MVISRALFLGNHSKDAIAPCFWGAAHREKSQNLKTFPLLKAPCLGRKSVGDRQPRFCDLKVSFSLMCRTSSADGWTTKSAIPRPLLQQLGCLHAANFSFLRVAGGRSGNLLDGLPQLRFLPRLFSPGRQLRMRLLRHTACRFRQRGVREQSVRHGRIRSWRSSRARRNATVAPPPILTRAQRDPSGTP